MVIEPFRPLKAPASVLGGSEEGGTDELASHLAIRVEGGALLGGSTRGKQLCRGACEQGKKGSEV